MSSNITEKLLKLQQVCESKIEKIAKLELIRDNNEIILADVERGIPSSLEVAQLSLELSTIRYQLEFMKNKLSQEEEYQKELKALVSLRQQDLQDSIAKLDTITSKIVSAQCILQRHVSNVYEYVNSKEENYLMMQEEYRSYTVLLNQMYLGNRQDQRLEWLEKLVIATRSQHNEAEKRLLQLQNKN